MNEKYTKALDERNSNDPLVQLRGYMVIEEGLFKGDFKVSHRTGREQITDEEKAKQDRASGDWNADAGFFMKVINGQGMRVCQYKAKAFPMTAKQCETLNTIINRAMVLLEIAND